jgi:hypothetical protein
VETLTPTLRIFCAYAIQDRVYFERLEKALAVPIQQQRIAVWHHGEITPGTEFDTEIENQLHRADMVLLFVSPEFMASDYCSTKEMQWALTRQQTGDARVIPLIVKSTPDWETTSLGLLQVLPTGKKPITTWKKQDEAFTDIANGLLKVVWEMQQEERFPAKEYRIFIRELPEIATQDTSLQKLRVAENSISGTSQQLMLIDHLLQVIQLPYQELEWTLLHGLEVADLAAQFGERTGKMPVGGRVYDTIDLNREN